MGLKLLSFSLDPYFDFQAEANGPEYDPNEFLKDEFDSDRWSPTLREYHRALWAKQLPNGDFFDLEPASQNRLIYRNQDSEMYLASDRAVPSFSHNKKLMQLLGGPSSSVVSDFRRLSNTMGGIVIWPSKRRANKMTINGYRGFNRKIADRLDLTLECIRLFYEDTESPLYETFKRYQDFFDLFVDFKGYIEFFLLQDWLKEEGSSVNFALPFRDFSASGIPQNKTDYLSYVEATRQMLISRNERIRDYLPKSPS